MIARRNVGITILVIILGAIIGSVLSHFLSGLFPAGPVKDFFFKALDWVNEVVAKKIEPQGDVALDIVDFSGGPESATIIDSEASFGGTGIRHDDIPEYAFNTEGRLKVGPQSIGLEKMYAIRLKADEEQLQVLYSDLNCENGIDDFIEAEYGKEFRSAGVEDRTMLFKQFKLTGAEPLEIARIFFKVTGNQANPINFNFLPTSELIGRDEGWLGGFESELFKPFNWYKGEFFTLGISTIQ